MLKYSISFSKESSDAMIIVRINRNACGSGGCCFVLFCFGRGANWLDGV